ncbi:gliding motility lipoprotein GldD [Flavobacteriaceae bacterium PRS1]|nr:gliding motility lipoprotein GldD [Flavobacteriaceae bacterium PRS1]
MKNIFFLFAIVFFMSCGNEPMPKPKAFLRLEYPKPQYKEVNTNLPFTFKKNSIANKIGVIKSSRNKKTLGLEVTYPTIKATIFLTYKKIDANNLQLLINDAQNITQSHARKADAITGQSFGNLEQRVYGMFYEVDGNVASQAQFYVTDSITHFLTGSLYFYVKPNYDSILPAADYLKKDIQHIMETLKWKE